MRKTIFIVDDDPGIRDAMKLALDSAEYDVNSFENGEELFKERLRHPDLILLDKQLPGVDGLDICKRLKSESGTSTVPVIIFSASPHLNHAAKLAGADDVLEKPFSISSLRSMVKKHLQK